MPKYIALHGFCIGGGVDVKEGEFVMVPDGRLKEWLWSGHIAAVHEPDDAVALVTQDEKATNREPLTARSIRR